MSADLYWMVTRDTSSFMMKGRLSKNKIFTKEPMNLTGLHSLTSSGVVGAKAVGVAAAADNKGVVLVTKKPKGNQSFSVNIGVAVFFFLRKFFFPST